MVPPTRSSATSATTAVTLSRPRLSRLGMASMSSPRLSGSSRPTTEAATLLSSRSTAHSLETSAPSTSPRRPLQARASSSALLAILVTSPSGMLMAKMRRVPRCTRSSQRPTSTWLPALVTWSNIESLPSEVGPCPPLNMYPPGSNLATRTIGRPDPAQGSWTVYQHRHTLLWWRWPEEQLGQRHRWCVRKQL